MSVKTHVIENQMTQYEEKVEICDRCFGTGDNRVSIEELQHYLYQNFMDYKTMKPNPGTFRDAIKIYRKWRAEHTLPCEYCDGQGQWIERW